MIFFFLGYSFMNVKLIGDFQSTHGNAYAFNKFFIVCVLFASRKT